MTKWIAALDRELERWRGGKYADNGATYHGVNCVNFVDRVLNALHGTNWPPLPLMPPDVSLHDKAGAMAAARVMAKRYPHHSPRVADPMLLQPGDVVVIKATGTHATPGHVMIMSSMPYVAWHAVRESGVTQTSVTATWGLVVRVWRPTLREEWV